MGEPAHKALSRVAPDQAVCHSRSGANNSPQTEPAVVPEPARRQTAVARQTLLLALGCIMAGALCLLQYKQGRANAGELALRQTRAARLAADARAIAQLRDRPRQAAETGLQQADLLARVAVAMKSAGLPPSSLISTLPQPARRIPNSDHAELTHRLILENVPLEALVRFGHGLTAASAELRVSGVHLRAGTARTEWNADVSVAYWVLAPRKTQ